MSPTKSQILYHNLILAIRSTQETLEGVAKFLERAANTFSWEIPFSCYVLIVVFFIITIVLYFVPLRLLLSVWGTNKVSFFQTSWRSKTCHMHSTWCSICLDDFIISNILFSITNSYYWNRIYKAKTFHHVKWRAFHELIWT